MISKSFFTADWHLFHENIIEYCNRPFKNTHEMHRVLVHNHNEIVNKNDNIWILGDITMLSSEHMGTVARVINKFNGIKHLVVGNHDEWRIRAYRSAGFTTVHSAMWADYKGSIFYMMHDPAEYTVIENDPKATMFCGHIHKLFKHLLPQKRIINVGIDVWDYKPVSFQQLLELIVENNI